MLGTRCVVCPFLTQVFQGMTDEVPFQLYPYVLGGQEMDLWEVGHPLHVGIRVPHGGRTPRVIGNGKWKEVTSPEEAREEISERGIDVGG